MASPLIIFSGESNSGGQARNTSATTSELSPRPGVLILNNSTLQFEILDIGTNNLIGHLSATAEMNAQTVHGWELELANQSPRFRSQVYLCKTGCGGSTINEWQSTNLYYITFLRRINAVKSLGVLGASSYKPVLWYTQGINDAIAGNNVSVWGTRTIAHFAKIRLEFPNIPILFTNVTPSYPTYTAEIIRITNTVPNCHYISCDGASLKDTNHWDYFGMKLISSRLIEKTLQIFDKQSFSAAFESIEQPFSGLTFGLARSVVKVSTPNLTRIPRAKDVSS